MNVIISRDKETVLATFRANGIYWKFSHARSTEFDAANLHTLISQEMRADAESAANELERLRKQNAHLSRVCAGLKGAVTRMRRRVQ